MNNYHVKKSYLSDINNELILPYKVIQNKHKPLIKYLETLKEEFLKKDQENRKEYYLKIRSKYNQKLENFNYNLLDDESIERAGQTIFMNKTGFNGLFRVNKKGEFNVPCGRYENPNICDKENIENVHHILKDNNVTIVNKSFLESEKIIDKNSFVYLDPPYRPISTSSAFTSYSKYEFNDNDQKELAEYYKRLDKKGTYLMLSNSDPKNTNPEDNFFDDLYSDFNIERIPAKRSINSNGKKRGNINELLIRNYK